MTSISIAISGNLPRLSFREKIVEGLKIWLVIKPLQLIFNSSVDLQLRNLTQLPKGTIGYDIYQLLNKYDLKIIPKFESHDLKHLILGYGMSSIEEIRMQMYLLGNGDYSIPCLLFVASGILFPKEWSTFHKDYKKGKRSPSILHLSISDCKMEKTKLIKDIYTKR